MCIEDIIIARMCWRSQRAVNVTAAPTIILPADKRRIAAQFVGGTAGAYWVGAHADVAVNFGHIIPASSNGFALNDNANPGASQQEWWCIRATVDVAGTVFEYFFPDDPREIARIMDIIKSGGRI